MSEKYTVRLIAPEGANTLVLNQDEHDNLACQELGKASDLLMVDRATWTPVDLSKALLFLEGGIDENSDPNLDSKDQVWYRGIPPYAVDIVYPKTKLLSPYRFEPWTKEIETPFGLVSWKRLRNSVNTYLLTLKREVFSPDDGTWSDGWFCYFVHAREERDFPESCLLQSKSSLQEAQAFLEAHLQKEYLKSFDAFSKVYDEMAEKYGVSWRRAPKEESPWYAGNHAAQVEKEITLYAFDDPECELLAFFHELGHTQAEPLRFGFSVTLYEGQAWIWGLQALEKLGYRWDGFSDPPMKWAHKQMATYYYSESDILSFSRDELMLTKSQLSCHLGENLLHEKPDSDS